MFTRLLVGRWLCLVALCTCAVFSASVSDSDSGNALSGAVSESTPSATQAETESGGDSTDIAAGDSAVTRFETTVVRARRNAKDRSAVTELRAADFAGLFTDLPSVLEQVSGLTIRRTGAFGEYADASIRGSSPSQVQVYLDGIPLNSAGGGAVDLSKISLNSLRAITVYKGSAPLDLMGNTAGGVINLTTDADSDMFSGIAEVGSYGYYKAGMLGRKRFGNVVQHFAVDFASAKNDYEFEYDNNTPYNPDDDSTRNKDNNSYAVINATYSNSWEPAPSHKFFSLISYTRERKEFFHKFLVDTLQEAQQTSNNAHAFVRWEHQLGDKGYMGAKVKGRIERRVYSDPLGVAYVGGERKEQNDYPYISGAIDGLWILNAWFSIKGLIQGSYEGYGQENLLATPAQDPPAAHRFSGGAALEMAAAWDKLHVAARYNHIYSSDSANFRPNRGAGKPLPKVYSSHFPNANLDVLAYVRPWLTLDFSARHEFLPITLSDRYGWGNNYLGNPNLRPEQKSEASIGVSVASASAEASLSGFIGFTRDYTKLSTNSQQVVFAVNAGDARYSGGECDVRVRLFGRILVDNHFTFIYKQVRDTGLSWDDSDSLRSSSLSTVGRNKKVILYDSPIQDDFRITLLLGPARLGHGVHYRSPFFEGYTTATDKVTPLPTMSAHASVVIREMLTLTYRIENYLDVTYEPIANFAPLPGRMHFFIGQIGF